MNRCSRSQFWRASFWCSLHLEAVQTKQVRFWGQIGSTGSYRECKPHSKTILRAPTPSLGRSETPTPSPGWCGNTSIYFWTSASSRTARSTTENRLSMRIKLARSPFCRWSRSRKLWPPNRCWWNLVNSKSHWSIADRIISFAPTRGKSAKPSWRK